MADPTAETSGRRSTSEREPDRHVVDSLARPGASRALWGVALVAVVGDLATTMYGLEIGLREQNPVVAAALHRYGVGALVGLKLVAVAWAVVVWVWMDRRYGVAAVAGLTVPQTLAVVLNVLTILSA